jgi:hypothetical protein
MQTVLLCCPGYRTFQFDCRCDPGRCRGSFNDWFGGGLNVAGYTRILN